MSLLFNFALPHDVELFVCLQACINLISARLQRVSDLVGSEFGGKCTVILLCASVLFSVCVQLVLRA